MFSICFTSFHWHDTHIPVFFFTPLCFFFFLNSSLFCAHVYFYPSVHGRSQRNDEAWETCSSPWQLYSKPSFPNAAFITTSHTSVALILLSQLSGMFFHIFSSGGFSHIHDSSPRLPPPPKQSRLWPLWTNGHAVVIPYLPTSHDCVCGSRLFHHRCEAHFRVAENLFGLCAVQGGFPHPQHPPHYPFFTGSCWEMQICLHPFHLITAVWHRLSKPGLNCCLLIIILITINFNCVNIPNMGMLSSYRIISALVRSEPALCILPHDAHILYPVSYIWI